MWSMSTKVKRATPLRAKVVMADWALTQKVGFVAVGAAGGKRLAHKGDVDDLSKITHDPLLAQVR